MEIDTTTPATRDSIKQVNIGISRHVSIASHIDR
jgi:hypothetical protein